MNDPGLRSLWSIPGDGVLARQGDLVLLISIDDQRFAESLVDLLTRTSEAGGDGRALADAIGAQVERHQSWGELRPGPAIVAFGPAGNGLAFAVSGTAFADISTSHGTARLAAGHPSVLQRSVVGVPVQSVRAGLGGNGTGNDRTDRFTRLDRGTVRASGLSYLLAQPDAPAAASEPPTLPPGAPEPAEPTFRASARPSFQPGPPPPPSPPSALSPPSAAGEFTPPPAEATPPPGEFTLPPAPVVPNTGPAALYELGLEEPGVAGSAPAPATSLSSAVPPAPEPAPAPDHAPAEAGGNGSAPIVLGVHCKNGHFTDPDARLCVVCGTGVKRRSAAPQRGPRPPLGVLVLDDGATLPLDGAYVIGRDPSRDQLVSDGQARPLRVVDAEKAVSRIHARIQLDGWQVLLTDLGSANGTRIQQGSAKTEQVLEPQIPAVLQHGARICVGTPCIRYERSGR